jgi:Zn finger protein HypA/HybF involved in hydrogenase expression
MAEHVASNYLTICRGKMKCTCGSVHKLQFKPNPGSGSQRLETFQCPVCRKITMLVVHGDGLIRGEGVTAR